LFMTEMLPSGTRGSRDSVSTFELRVPDNRAAQVIDKPNPHRLGCLILIRGNDLYFSLLPFCLVPGVNHLLPEPVEVAISR